MGLRAIGANWIALIVECEQQGTDIECPTNDAAVAAEIERARAAGLKVMLKPHVQTRQFAWRGEIQFKTAREWARWWDAYRALVFRYARLRADAFVVGTELRQMSAGAQHRVWRDLIQIARQNCACPILYAANFDEAAQIPWWDAVDFIGIDAYFPLSAPAAPRIDDLVHAWEPHKTRLGLLASTRGKPIVFTEVGYQSRVSAHLTPWQRDPAVLDT